MNTPGMLMVKAHHGDKLSAKYNVPKTKGIFFQYCPELRMIKNSIFSLMLTALYVSTAHAEFFKCVNASGSTVYSDNPCNEGDKYKQQSLDVQVPAPIDINVGYSKFTTGLIDGYTGTFPVKDSIAHIKKIDKMMHVDLWLYPFQLNTEEIGLVKKGDFIGRGGLKPVRFNFSFPASVSNNIKIEYQDIAITGLYLDNGTLITTSDDQWIELTESIKFRYFPDEGRFSFVIKEKLIVIRYSSTPNLTYTIRQQNLSMLNGRNH